MTACRFRGDLQQALIGSGQRRGLAESRPSYNAHEIIEGRGQDAGGPLAPDSAAQLQELVPF